MNMTNKLVALIVAFPLISLAENSTNIMILSDRLTDSQKTTKIPNTQESFNSLKKSKLSSAQLKIQDLDLSNMPDVRKSLGTNSGGGGDIYVEQFVALADSIINQVAFEPQDKEILEDALKTAKIMSVDNLIDPSTGQIIPDQTSLVAWGYPGLIQLKRSSSNTNDATWGRLLENKSSVAQYVIHELYRSSGIVGKNGKSIDDTFQLSIGKYHLDRFAGNAEGDGFNSTEYQKRVEKSATDVLVGLIGPIRQVQLETIKNQSAENQKAPICLMIGSIYPWVTGLYTLGYNGDRTFVSRAAVSEIALSMAELNGFCGIAMKFAFSKGKKKISTLSEISVRLEKIKELAQKINQGAIK